ncbi:hypothetical protein [Polaromonas sp. CG9_12]|nr:hypothetical protein [Polaromonas sp. CG9_12]
MRAVSSAYGKRAPAVGIAVARPGHRHGIVEHLGAGFAHGQTSAPKSRRIACSRSGKRVVPPRGSTAPGRPIPWPSAVRRPVSCWRCHFRRPGQVFAGTWAAPCANRSGQACGLPR